MKILFFIATISLVVCCQITEKKHEPDRLTDYVNVFIGTGGHIRQQASETWKNKYIQSTLLNGKTMVHPFLSHFDIIERRRT